MATDWISRAGEDELIGKCRVTHNGANVNYANVNVVPPWGASYNLTLVRDVVYTKYNPKHGGELFRISYTDYWDGAIRITCDYILQAPPPEPEPEPEPVGFAKAKIISASIDGGGMNYYIGDNIPYSSQVFNVGYATGTIFMLVGLGIIEADGNIKFNGAPTQFSEVKDEGTSEFWNGNIGVYERDLTRQSAGKDIYLFFVAGHLEGPEIVYDGEMHQLVDIKTSNIPDPYIPDDEQGEPAEFNFLGWILSKIGRIKFKRNL